MLNAPMLQFAVIGDPIQHSLSPRIFKLFAEQTGCALDYKAIAVKPWDLSYALARLQEEGFCGLNVTSPLKEKAFSLVNDLSAAAQKAGAVNVISFREDGAYYGDNSDGVGFIRDLTKRQQCTLRQKTILVLGAGGAVRGIMGALLAMKPAKVVITNRTAVKAQHLAEEYQKENYPVFSCGWDDIAATAYDVVIQATAAGVKDEALLLPAGILKEGAYCYDLVYGKGHLFFQKWAKAQGAIVCADGLGMLVEQAAEAFHLWCQKRADTGIILQHLRTSS